MYGDGSLELSGGEESPELDIPADRNRTHSMEVLAHETNSRIHLKGFLAQGDKKPGTSHALYTSPHRNSNEDIFRVPTHQHF
jgi:hypothetical protein